MVIRCDILLVVVYINITDTKKIIHINILVPLVMELHRGSELDINIYYVPLVQIDYRTCSTHEFRTTLMQHVFGFQQTTGCVLDVNVGQRTMCLVQTDCRTCSTYQFRRTLRQQVFGFQ